jgi:phospholipid-transporting ATPase
MMNSIRARPKRSTLENDTGKHVVLTFGIQLCICLFSGLFYSFWEAANVATINQYISKAHQSFFITLMTRMGNWVLIFGNFVPISLLLTLETVKFFQGYLMGIDKGLVSDNGIECKVQSSNLNEELGQIDYVFSDKTGTLTCNEMRFKYLIVGKEVYGQRRGYQGEVPDVKNVDFEDPHVWDIINKNFMTEQCVRVRDALLLLGLCHNVVIEHNGDFNASSPDELAFVYFSKLVGCEFKGMDEDNFIVLKEFNEEKKYKMLDIFEFTSDRKRMSIILQDKSGEITLYTKGADSIMIPRYHQDKIHEFDELMDWLNKFARMGLRTLLLGMKKLTRSEYEAFKKEYDAAKNNLENRDAEMAKVEDQIERDLTLVGATAIEDKLQDKLGSEG